jgi:hypothetical protein
MIYYTIYAERRVAYKDFMITKERSVKFILPFTAAAMWTVVSLFYERSVFEISPLEAAHNYIPCKIIMFLAVFAFVRFVITALADKQSFSRQVLKYALIYFIPIILVLVYKIPEGFLTNDESLIFAEASKLADYTWFYYITTWYYIISIMLIPSWLGPIVIKVLIQCLSAGYTLARLDRYMHGSRKSLFLYIAFFLPPILAYTTSAHRIPIYIFLYVLFMFKLFMDRLEEVPFSWKTALPMLFLLAVLTQWRTEGIYLAVFGPLLMLLCYPSFFGKNEKQITNIVKLILLSFLIQYIVAVPQYGFIPSRMGDKAANRMLPFYAYTVTNMYRNGLDTDDPANAASLEKIDRYLNVETIAGINDYLGDINYEDALILYYQGYDGRREGADDEDYMAFVEGSRELMQHNPDVLIRTKWGSFDYAATVYDPVLGFGLPALAVSLVKTVSYNLYLPMLLLIGMFVYSLVKLKERAWTSVFFVLLSLCLLAHFAIVFILAPASYFKYYFPVYFTTYFFVILCLILFSGKKSVSE